MAQLKPRARTRTNVFRSSASVFKLLSEKPRLKGNEFVFPGARPKRPLSNMAMRELLRGMRPAAGLLVHGVRSSFRDWAGECTNHPREVVETALAHVFADKTGAAYRRGDALEKRRRLMEDWCKYCGGRQ